MPFITPTLQETVDRIESDFKSRITGASSLLRRSVLRVMARVYAGAIHIVYKYLLFVKDQLFATTADTENLELIGTEYGINRKSATWAQGYATVTGTNGVLVPVGVELSSGAGNTYTVDEAVVISGGTGTIAVTAKEAGTTSNDSSGITLSFVSPLVGINTAATVTSAGLTGGLEEETDDELRARILTRKAQPPYGGASFDYINWALEVPGVTRAWCLEQYHGPGTVVIAFTRDNDSNSIIPTTAHMDAVYDYIVEHITSGQTIGLPITAKPGLFMIPLHLRSIDFHIRLYPNTDAVQADIEANLSDLMVSAGPDEPLYYSKMTAAVANSLGEESHRILTPSDDVGIAINEIPVLGIVTYEDY